MAESVIHLRVPAARKGRWIRFSRAAGMRLNDWVVDAVERNLASDPSVFDLAVATTRLQPRAINIARMVIINGTTAAEAARTNGVSREYARQKVARVQRAIRELI